MHLEPCYIQFCELIILQINAYKYILNTNTTYHTFVVALGSFLCVPLETEKEEEKHEEEEKSFPIFFLNRK